MDDRYGPAYLGAKDWFRTTPANGASMRAVAAPAPAPVFELRELLAILRQRWTLIAFCVAALAIAAGIYGLTAQKRYVATTQLLIDTRGLKVVEGDVNQRFENAETLNADLESQMRILMSTSVLRAVVDREHLTNDPDFVPRPGLLGRLRAMVLGRPAGSAEPEATAAGVLERALTVRRSERSFVVDISVAASTPAKAARLAQAVAEGYIDEQANTRQLITKRIGEEVAARLKDLRTQVEAAEKRVEDYKARNNLSFANGKLTLDQDATELTTQLNLARARTARARARVDQIRALGNRPMQESAAEVLDSPAIVQLRLRLAEAQRQEQELRQSLGPRHPELVAAAARVAEARRAIDQEVARRKQAAELELAQALNSEKAINVQLDRTRKETTDAGQSLIGIRELERAADANRRVYEQFLVRAREITEQSGFQPNQTRIISPANEPVSPTGLSVPVLTILGGIAGLPLGIGLALLGHFFGPGATGPASPRPATRRTAPTLRTSVPTFADINRSFVHNYVATRKFQRALSPPPAVSEVAGRIQRLAPDDPLRIILVCSVEDAEIGSEFALALASSFAWEGLDVIAVDGDATTMGLSQLSGIVGQPGLYDRLEQGNSIEDSVEWKRNGLPHLLPATMAGGKPVSRDARRELVDRLERLCANVNMLIVDAGIAASNPFIGLLAEAASDCIVAADVNVTNAEKIAATYDAVSRAGTLSPQLVSVSGEKPSTPPSAELPAVSAQVGSPNTDEHDKHRKKRWYFGRQRIVGEGKPEKT